MRFYRARCQVSLPLSRLIFKKSRIGWSMGFVPSFFGTPCGYTRVISWAQPKLWLPLTALSQLARQPALRLCRHVEFAGPLLSRGLSFMVSCSRIQLQVQGPSSPRTYSSGLCFPSPTPSNLHCLCHCASSPGCLSILPSILE